MVHEPGCGVDVKLWAHLSETLHETAAGDPDVVERFLERLRQEAVRLSRLVTSIQ